MFYLVHIGQAPLGVVRALGSRVWFALPGVAGTLVAYSYFPQPTLPGQSQNLAGDDDGGSPHVCTRATQALTRSAKRQTLWSSPKVSACAPLLPPCCSTPASGTTSASAWT